MIKIIRYSVALFIISIFFCLFVSASDYSEVVLYNDSTYNDIISNNKTPLNISGHNSEIKLSLPTVVRLENDTMIDNLVLSGECTIYACGYNLYIGENVTSDSRLTVYGGSDSFAVENTNVELCGGLYKAVYGGGLNYSVRGNTKIIFGGNCNKGDDINDQNTTTWSPCYIYGGGNNGSVSGSTYIYLEDNAVARYIFGAGVGSGGTAVDTNIVINGGKVMNVYGGTTNTELSGCNTHITMNGGKAEAIFGGSSQKGMTGNTYVTLLGGEVTRRVYTGCYNDWSLWWKTSYYVTGTTNLIIGPSMNLNTKNGLASQNQTNVGVFAGSRLGNNGNANEINTVVFLDDCYSSKKNSIGDKSGWSIVFYSNADYTVDCGKGGIISFDKSSGKLVFTPDFGNYMTVDGVFFDNYIVDFSSSKVTTIDFPMNFGVTSVDVSTSANNGNITAFVCCENKFASVSPRIFVSLVNSNNKTIAIYSKPLIQGTTEYSFASDISDFSDIDINFFIVNNKFVPLCPSYTLNSSN